MKYLICFSGSGLRFPFHLGVLKSLYHKLEMDPSLMSGDYFPGERIQAIGISGGSIGAMTLASGLSPVYVYQRALESLAENYHSIFEPGVMGPDGPRAEGIVDLLGLRFSDFFYLLKPGGKKEFVREMMRRVSSRSILGGMDRVEKLFRGLFPEPGHTLAKGQRPTIGITNMATKLPEYRMVYPGEDFIPLMLASASMPGVWPHQRLGVKTYADGGITDRLGTGGIDLTISKLGWQGKPVTLIISDARPVTRDVSDPDSSVSGLNRAYLAATEERKPFDFKFQKILTVRNWDHAPGSLDISDHAIQTNFLNGAQEASAILGTL